MTMITEIEDKHISMNKNMFQSVINIDLIL